MTHIYDIVKPDDAILIVPMPAGYLLMKAPTLLLKSPNAPQEQYPEMFAALSSAGDVLLFLIDLYGLDVPDACEDKEKLVDAALDMFDIGRASNKKGKEPSEPTETELPVPTPTLTEPSISHESEQEIVTDKPPDGAREFAPIKMPEIPEPARVVTGDVSATSPDKTQPSEQVAATPKSKPRGGSSSQYKGVKKAGKRWSATAYLHKKVKHVGTFDTELEAAIKVQQHLGDDAEVTRLERLVTKQEEPQKFLDRAEQEESNPDRSPRTAKKADWECNKCSHLHKAQKRPVKCKGEGCKNQSFIEILPSGEGAFDYKEPTGEQGPDKVALATGEVAE